MGDLRIRWKIRRDLDETLSIDADSYRKSWSEQRFLSCLRRQNCIGLVAEVGETVAGFVIYQLEKDHIKIRRLAVDPGWRFQGIGQEMIAKLVGKLSHARRHTIDADVSEHNVAAQLFLAKLGFQCVATEGRKMTFRYKIPTLRESA